MSILSLLPPLALWTGILLLSRFAIYGGLWEALFPGIEHRVSRQLTYHHSSSSFPLSCSSAAVWRVWPLYSNPTTDPSSVSALLDPTHTWGFHSIRRCRCRKRICQQGFKRRLLHLPLSWGVQGNLYHRSIQPTNEASPQDKKRIHSLSTQVWNPTGTCIYLWREVCLSLSISTFWFCSLATKSLACPLLSLLGTFRDFYAFEEYVRGSGGGASNKCT